MGNGLALHDANNGLVGEFFSPLAFQINHFEDSSLYFGFPPGFPLLLALPGPMTNTVETIHYVVPVLAAVGLLLTFVLGNWLVKNEWVALLGTGIIPLSRLLAFWYRSLVKYHLWFLCCLATFFTFLLALKIGQIEPR